MGPILTLPYHYWSLRQENEGLPMFVPKLQIGNPLSQKKDTQKCKNVGESCKELQ